MATATQDKLAPKFRDMAARLESEIAAKRAQRRENTPKQNKEAACQRIDADHLDRVREALLALAEAREEGLLPCGLECIKSKAQVLTMLRTRIDCSGGYYSVRDTGEFSDQSALAVFLREWIAARRSPETAQQRKEAARLNRIRDLEASVKFSTIPGFFPTPPAVIERMLELAQIEPGMRCLEPSAGKGDIADALVRAGAEVYCCEINHTLCEILLAKGHTIDQEDFLTWTLECHIDRVLMNPPFERGQDVEHVQHAYTFLRPGGRLVSVMSAGSFTNGARKFQEFRDWFEAACSEVYDVEPGAFNGAFRSTGVSCKLVVIDKE